MRRPNSKATNTDQLWESFRQTLLAKDEKRPPGEGWMTFDEICKKFKIGEKAARKATATLDRFSGAINKDGRLIRCIWYRPKQ